MQSGLTLEGKKSKVNSERGAGEIEDNGGLDHSFIAPGECRVRNAVRKMK